MSEDTEPQQVLVMNDELPDLVIPHPECGHCGNAVTIEDNYAYCTNCMVEWDSVYDGERSVLDVNQTNNSEARCETIEGKQGDPYEHNGRSWTFGPRQPCILPAGHKSKHLCPYDLTITPVSGNSPG